MARGAASPARAKASEVARTSTADLPGATLATLRTKCQMRVTGMENYRWTWWDNWRDLARFINPRLGRFQEMPNTSGRGRPKNGLIIDNTGLIASQRFASGLMAGVCSPARPWFTLKLAGREFAEGSPVTLWLAEVEKRMMSIFAGSNFYRSVATLFEEIGVFGTGVMLMYEDYDDALRCYPLACGEYYLSVDDRLEVTTFARKIVMTAGQMVTQFGLENCSASVQNAYLVTGSNDTEFLIGHIIAPNDKRVYDAPGAKGMPWMEVYWEWGDVGNEVLSERGYNEKPFVAPRWNVTANDPYGRSPGMDAQGDVKQLQVMTKRCDQLVDKLVNPPMTAPNTMKNEPTTVIPGGVTFLPPGQPGKFEPAYVVDGRGVPAISDRIALTQNRIKTAFYEDLFLMISNLDTERTATEIVARKEEKMLMLGPALERLHDELLSPAIERMFGIMERYGLLPPDRPEEVQGQKPAVEFVSILAQAQRAVSTAALERLWAFVGNLAAAKPDALDNVDADDSIREYAQMVGAPPKVIVEFAEMLAKRKARDDAMAQQMQFQQSMEAAQGAKTLSETEVGGGINALALATGRT